MEKSFVREIWRKATKLSSLKTISGEVTILGDKSISHRCIILGSLAEGESSFENILISGDTAATIDVEVSELVDIAYKRATKVLSENRSVLDEMAQMLIERETIDTEDIQDLLDRSEVKMANYI